MFIALKGYKKGVVRKKVGTERERPDDQVIFDENRNMKDWYTIAYDMEHPNGVHIYGDYLYVTQSYLTKIPDKFGKLVSGV